MESCHTNVMTQKVRDRGWLIFVGRALIGVLGALAPQATALAQSHAGSSDGIQAIRHVIIIMQENRSFDSYFGTFPGADGIPMKDGVPTICLPYYPGSKSCLRPFLDHLDINGGGPHGAISARIDMDNGKMDGFIEQALGALFGCSNVNDPRCAFGNIDVAGYHDGSDIPNYWSYASHFVLQDHMFEPDATWSLPAHLFAVSEWSARCKSHDPMSCVNRLDNPALPPDYRRYGAPPPHAPVYAWTDLTYLLHQAGISWGYYVKTGSEPDCEDDEEENCAAVTQNAKTPGVWNPLPFFDTVHEDGEIGNIQPVENFYQQAANGTLPAVSWVVPSQAVSEHPPSQVSAGQSYVTGLINAVMQGPDWSSCAIFVTWDDWGGFYDHATPPKVDRSGYGLRVPGLVISPFAKGAFIDHQTLSFDAYVKFIEDDFLGSARLDPATDGRPDRRPDVRENSTTLGDLVNDFDFSQSARPPLVLPINPRTALISPGVKK
jgi:phospholipase C